MNGSLLVSIFFILNFDELNNIDKQKIYYRNSFSRAGMRSRIRSAISEEFLARALYTISFGLIISSTIYFGVNASFNRSQSRASLIMGFKGLDTLGFYLPRDVGFIK